MVGATGGDWSLPTNRLGLGRVRRFRPSPAGHAAFRYAFAPGKEGRIVAPCIGGITKAANGAWIERKSRLRCSPRFVQLPEPRECGREIEMRDGIIPVCVEAPAHPEDCFGIGTKLRLSKAHI